MLITLLVALFISLLVGGIFIYEEMKDSDDDGDEKTY